MDEFNNRPCDQQLMEDIRSNRRSGKAGKVLVCVGLIIVAIGAVAGFMIPVMIAGAVLSIIGERIQEKKRNEVAHQLSGSVVQDALKAVLEDPALDPNKSLGYKPVDGSGIPLIDHSSVRGSNYVRGRYKGMEVELSSIDLYKDTSTYIEEMNQWKESEDVIYRGQWLVCRFGVPSNVDLTLCPSGKLDRLFRRDSIKTGNETFDKRFRLGSDTEPALRSFLTPGRVERLLAMADTADGGLSLALRRDGTLYIAVQSGHGFFDIGKARESAAELRERFTRELRWYTDMIDLMRPAGGL